MVLGCSATSYAVCGVIITLGCALQGFTQMFQRSNIVTMASGGQAPNFVFYFYAQAQESQVWFLLHLTASSQNQGGQLTVKSNTAAPEQEQLLALVQSLVC